MKSAGTTESLDPITRYISAQAAPARRALRAVRRAIRKALPGASETISYKMPAYRVHGRVALYFAAWRDHCALYPGSAKIRRALGAALASYAGGKGTIRFPLDRPVPVALIARIAKMRAQELAPDAPARKRVSRSRVRRKPAARRPAR